MRIISVLIFLAGFLGVWFFREPLVSYLEGFPEQFRQSRLVETVASDLPKVEERGVELVKQIQKEVQAPPPLRAKEEAPASFLSRAGVISWSNSHREDNNLPSLKENTRLDLAATLKLKDMFEGQYFEHLSPSGAGPAEVVKQAGYEFILVGENLALGNFADDKTLVQGWMNSPGHRANILNSRFQEIGVAVAKGIFEGRETWLAVQEFALPLSECPAPDESIKMTALAYESRLNDLARLIEVKREEIENTRPKRGAEYNSKIEEYNALVNEYNSLVNEDKSLVSSYNSQVNSFNSCLQGFTF